MCALRSRERELHCDTEKPLVQVSGSEVSVLDKPIL